MDLVCRCPFHEGDDTPSLVVTPGKNLFHCFACSAAGSPIDWVMRQRGVSFRRAVEWLRAQVGLIDKAAPMAAARDPAALKLAPLAPSATTRRCSTK